MQKSIDYREFRVQKTFVTILKRQKQQQQQQQGERLGTFPDPKLECNSGYARDVSTSPHLSSSFNVASPMEEFDPPGYVGGWDHMGSLDVESSLSTLQVDPPEAPLGGSQSCYGMPKVEFFPKESSTVT